MVNPTRAAVPTVEARHPARTSFGLEVHPDTNSGGCRAKHPEARLLCANFHILLLCERGSATQMVEFKQFHYRPGSLLWILPGVVHERVPAFTGRDLCFTSAFTGAELSDGPVGGAWNLEGADLVAVEALWTVLATEYSRYMDAPTGPRLVQNEVLLRHLLLALIKRLQGVPRAPGASEASNPLVSAFLRLAEEKRGEMVSVDEYARALGCSTRTLRRLCYAEVGITPAQVIDRQLAEAAEMLLATTDMPLATVARSLGFSDSANFSRFFKRETGLTPGVFRKGVPA
jgi:AraC-like DNA-binding protein